MTKEYFGSKVMRLREREAEIPGRACLNAISLKVGKTSMSRVFVRDVQSDGAKILKNWQKRAGFKILSQVNYESKKKL